METRQAKANHLPLEHCIESVNPGQMQKARLGHTEIWKARKKNAKRDILSMMRLETRYTVTNRRQKRAQVQIQ